MANAFEQFKTEFVTALACRIYTSTCNAYQVTSRTLSEVDKASVLKVDFVLKRLCSGDKVVVHCHADYHRTGFFIYVLLRRYAAPPYAKLPALPLLLGLWDVGAASGRPANFHRQHTPAQ